MRLSAPRGTRDIKDGEARAFRRLEDAARDVFRRYGYDEIRTPVFESVELFKRSVGETTDIVEKEMYVFKDRGDREMALRPEGTAGVVRAYLEHGWDKTAGLKKLFYAGPMFRAERPQAGRYREFWQLGAEFFGHPGPQADADTLLLIRDILSSFGVEKTRFVLNAIGCPACRPAYRDKLAAYLSSRKGSLCEDCKRRLDRNPLRVLDCKVDGPSFADAPAMAESLCAECESHDGELTKLLSSVGFVHERDPRLVRGLDYYTRTVFEIKAAGLGAQDALGAGGRYDVLVKSMGGPDTPAVGFALGMDRVCRAKLGDALEGPVQEDGAKKVFVALAGIGTGGPGFKLLHDLRAGGFTAEIGVPDRSLKSQLRWADAWGAGKVVLVGESEIARGKVLLKDLSRHTQEERDLAGLVSTL